MAHVPKSTAKKVSCLFPRRKDGGPHEARTRWNQDAHYPPRGRALSFFPDTSVLGWDRGTTGLTQLLLADPVGTAAVLH